MANPDNQARRIELKGKPVWSGKLSAGVVKSLSSVADDHCGSRPVLGHIYMDATTAVATDSWRLHTHTFSGPAEPAVYTAAVLRHLKGDAELSIYPDGATLASSGGVTAVGYRPRIKASDYPNWRRLIPQSATPWRVDAKAFSAAVKAVARPARDCVPVRCTPNEGAVTVHTVTQGVGTSSVTVPLIEGCPPCGFAFNDRYMLALVDAYTEADGSLLFEQRDQLTPITARSAGGVGLIMPMRVP